MPISEKNIRKLMIAMATLLLVTISAADGAILTVNVNDVTGYTRIQDAINNASAGDTILIQSGIYYENININKQLTLMGVGAPVVDAGQLNDAVTLNADGITLQGFTVTNATSYMGIRVTSSNNIIAGVNASNNYYGIYISTGNNNTLRGNNATNNNYGVYVYNSNSNNLSANNFSNNNNGYGIYLYSANNNTITGNLANGNYYGISLYYSAYNELTDNTANSGYQGLYIYSSNNNFVNGTIARSNTNGIFIYYSENVLLKNNLMSGNTYNFYLTGTQDSQYNHTIDTSNTVDGKPVYYVKDVVDANYDISSNAGTFYCIRCNNVTIEDVILTRNYYGLFFWKTYNSTIWRITSSNNSYGIYFSSSGNNNITGSDTDTNGYGVYFDSSNINNITSSSADKNSNYGIFFTSSNNNNIAGINANNNNYGIYFSSSNTNNITGSSADNNNYGIYSTSSTNNSITRSNVNNNSHYGIYLYYSNNHILNNNRISGNLNLDLNLVNSLNSGDNNTCDKPDGWNDKGVIGCRFLSQPLSNYPDFKVVGLTWDPVNFNISDNVAINAGVMNIGPANFSGYLYVGFYIDGILVTQTSFFTTINVNQTVNFTGYWNANMGGAGRTLTATADFNNNWAEVNETNNILNASVPYIQGPDLIVENITWFPDTFSAGQPVTFNATIRNTGNLSSPATYNYIGFFVDGNLFSTNYAYGPIAPNSNLTVTSSSWTALPGNHTVKALADYYNYVAETNETNNDLNSTLPYTPGPDMIIENITWSPGPYSANQMVIFTATIKNIGESGSPTTYNYVGFSIDGTIFSTNYIYGSLAPNASLTITSSSWKAMPGNHTIKVTADYYNYIAETNESNNDINVTLPHTQGPDMIIRNISWSPFNYSPGDTVTFFASVTNAGDNSTGIQYQYAGLFIDSAFIGYNYVYTDIAVGQNVTIPITWTAQGGNHTVRATADYFNNFNELNETNNDNSTGLPFVAPPDLVITNISWNPFNYTAGASIVLNATVQNTGVGSWKGPILVYFYYKNATVISSASPTMNIPPGGEGYAIATWSQAQAGDFYFRARADPNNNIIESNESNNDFYIRSNNVLIPDLIVDDIKLRIEHRLIRRGDQNDNIFWKYTNITPDPGWQNISFDDSKWSINRTPFGNYGSYRTFQDLGCGQAYFRNIFNANTSLNNTFTLFVASDDGVAIWVNGAAALNRPNDNHSYFYWNYQVNITPYMQQGDNILAIYLKNGACGNNYLDAELTNATITSGAGTKIDAGDSVGINATIKNIGHGNLSSIALYTYFYLDGGLFFTFYKAMNLPVNATDYVAFTWTATPGLHKIRVLADAANYINEVNENNNDMTVSLQSIAFPDLVIENLVYSPQNYTAGQTVTLSATIRNTGSGYAGSPFYTAFYVDGSSVVVPYSQNIIPPGGSMNISGTWTGQGGSHTLRAYADIYNYIPELNETNNDRTVVLTPTLPPDLIISAVTATKPGVNANVSDINTSDGELITFNATIMNIGIGNISATNLYVGFYVDGFHIADGLINQFLPVNGMANVSATWVATTGNHTFISRADPYNYILESNESNNDYSSKLAPILFSDIVVSSITWTPSNFTDGQPVTFNAVVENIGIGNTSRSFYTRFLIDGNFIGEQVINGGIASGSSATITRIWSATPGEHKIKAIADFYNQVSESNETNNTLELDLTRVDLPDLIVSKLAWDPLDFSDGQVVTFNATIRNIGSGNTTRDFWTRFQIDGVNIADRFISGGLGSSSSATFTLIWTATPGEHLITAMADIFNQVQESNETNNKLELNLTKASQPDLIVTNLTWTPSNITDGQVVTFNATIRNIGAGNTTRDFLTRFLIDNISIGDRSISGGLVSGSSVTVVQTFTATPGVHTITAMADIFDQVTESNEANNALELDLTPIDPPDLVVSSISWNPVNFSDGQVVNLNVTIRNTGPGNTIRGFWAGLLIDNISIREQFISGGLSPGSTATVSQTWTATPGEHTIEASVDIFKQVTESNEANNTLALNLTKADPPDLIVTSLTWTPLNFTDGQIVTFNATVRNTGAGNTTRVFHIGFLIDNVSIGEQSLSGLVSGSSATLTRTWIATPGRHTIKGAADIHNTIAESSEINNNLTMSLPAITILKPDATSRWSGIQAINWSIDVLNTSLTISSVYYWKPLAWAPPFTENSTLYFTQGNWILLGETGNTSFLWDTTGFNGYTKVKIAATDGTYTTTRLSDIFIVNNREVLIELGNHKETSGDFLTTQNPVIFGAVDATPINISQISINSSDFNLTKDPAGKPRGIFEFRTDSNYSGRFSVSLTAADEAGNTGNLSASFLVDPVPPVINSAAFANLFTENPISVTVNATDDRSIAEVDLAAFGQTLSLNLSADDLYRGSLLAPSAAGSYPAQITARDSAGNLNSRNYSLEILSGPDLEINASGIFFSPPIPVTGDLLNITAQINNPGSEKIDIVNVTFMANNHSIGSILGNLSVSSNVTLNWQTAGFAGNVTIEVRIENSTYYTETDYSNNNASHIIFIDGPDLAVTGIAFNLPSPVYAGQVVTIIATIENLRQIDADNVRITFYQNTVNLSDRIDFKDVNVPANSSVDVSVNWQTAGVAGFQTVFVEANTKNLPAEVDLSNNILNTTFETKEFIAEQIPDLITFPQKTLPGIPGEKVRGMASNDFNGDHKTDFVVGTDTGTIILYRNNGVFYTNNNKTKNVNFTRILIDNIGEGAQGLTSADFFKDGFPDLVVGTESGRVILYNNSNGVFVSSLKLLNAGEWAYGLAASDFNDDNKFDLVIGNKKGQVNLYLNNMAGNALANESMVFNRTLTTRDLPFGLTTGDFDLDGHIDVMVGDRLGQLERIVYENGDYQGFLFGDVGAFAHGLTAADVDYNGKLDLFTISFDGNVRMFFDREGALVANPLIIGNVPQSFGLTSGDYDSDNDIDLIVGSDNGNVTMLMNSLRIIKSSTPLPSPPRRNIEVETQIQNPWAREMIDTNLTEMWLDNVSFVKGAYPVLLGCDPFTGECSYFFADTFFFETPRDNSTYKTRYYLQFPNTVCKQTWTSRSGFWSQGCAFFNYNGEAVLQDRSFNMSNPLGIFDNLDIMRLREGFKYRYKFFPGSVTDVSAITNLNYSLLGAFNTPNTSFLLSDDVTNLNDITANSKNINPGKFKSDRDYIDNLVIAPDFTPLKLEFTGYSDPPVPNEQVTASATIRNLNNIAINDVKVMFLLNNEPVRFCTPTCRNYTTFNIAALGSTVVSTLTRLPSSVGGIVNVTVIVNPTRDDIETNYDNNNLSNSLTTLPPSDLSNDRVYFSNGSVIKNVFTEGEPITAFTDVSNIGNNQSFLENAYFLGFDTNGGNTGIVPVNRAVSCSIGSPDYEANLCGGTFDCRYRPCTSPGDIGPGQNITTNMSSVLGDFKVRSMGTYNFSTIITNVGSLDQNHDNDANFGKFVVLPSQEDLLFDPDFGILHNNPGGNNITFQYKELDGGGIDISNYDDIIYLDNNDSNILARLADQSLGNHTSILRSFTIDWSSIPPGDHLVNFYLDYGKNDIGSTARASSGDGLIFISNKPGISGTGLTVSIQNRELLKARLGASYSAGTSTIIVDSVSGFNTGDRIRIEGETYHDITDINITARALAINPALGNFLNSGRGVSIVLPDIFNLTITKTTEVTEQIPDFDMRTRTDTSSFVYNRLSDNITDIRNLGDIVNIIQNGGYNLSGYFVPSGLLHVDASGANQSAKPLVQSMNLIIPGSLTHERSEFNNQNSIIFRWKEVTTGGITFNPVFPSPRDVVGISSTISNQGDIGTGPFNITMYIDGRPFETQTISLLARESKPASFLFTIPGKSDKLTYDVRIFADPDNVIIQEDKSNNNATTSIPVSAPFELNILAKDENINFLSLYQNNGNTSFTPVTSGLEKLSMEYDATPVFVDYNNDSAYDMIIGSLDGKLRSFRNTGTNTNPTWNETDWPDFDWNPADVPTVNINGRNYQTVGISTLDVGARSAPEFVDLDNDTLADMVIGDTHGRLRSYKRIIAGAQVFNPQTGNYEFKIKRAWIEYDFNLSKVSQVLRAVPRFADLNGDGVYDLIVGNQFGKLVGYENIGNSTNPDWIQKDFNLSGIDGGTNAAPAISDVNSDGFADLIIGGSTGISIFENKGTASGPAWQKLNITLSIPGMTDYRPALADLNNDGNPDLVFGSNNPSRLKLKKGYFEPVGVQIINYARNQIDIARIELMVQDASSGNKITDIFQDGPFNQLVNVPPLCGPIDMIMRGYRLESQGAFEKEYDIDIPAGLPENAALGVIATRQEHVNPAYFYELGQGRCGQYTWLKGVKGAPIYINRPQLGGNTFDLFVDPGATYEISGSYSVYFNGTMSRQYSCSKWCPIYNLTAGEINTIVGSGEIRRLVHLSRNDFDIVKPEVPPISLSIDNKIGLELKPGYIENIDVSVTNNNRRQYNIDRIAIELFDPGIQTGNRTLGNDSLNITVPTFVESRIISLFTDTSGFSLPPVQTTQRRYKVYIPDGVPLGSMLLVKGVEKRPFSDDEYDRSNIDDLWPVSGSQGDFGGNKYGQDLAQSSLYNNTILTLFTDPYSWGKQNFDFGNGCFVCGPDGYDFCGPELSFLRKEVWIPRTLIKSEQKEVLTQTCTETCFEPPSGVTSWVEGGLKSSLLTECEDITYGWTPNYDNLDIGANNEFDLYSFGPHRQFDITLYDSVAFDYMQNTTVRPVPEAFKLNITDIGNHGLLRRQYEERVNVTVANNDDDPVTVDAIMLSLITPQNNKINLLTDTKSRLIPPESHINLTYLVLIPSDVPLGSRLTVQVERVFGFADRLWNRDHESNLSDLLAAGTEDYHWGDTLPTSESSKYRKHFFAPGDVTRAEMILGDRTFMTDAYLNGEFQGSGYPGWSPISLTSGLKPGQENLLSITGAIPDTESRIYSGSVKTGGSIIQPEEDVYFAVFGVREKQFVPDREPFFVHPGETVTARIRVENKYNKTLDYSMRLYVVDFNTQGETTISTQTLTVRPYEIKNLEVDLTIPDTVSNQTRLELSSVWNEKLSDKNWLRGSNFHDEEANNKFLNDSQWGVVEVGPDNERAIYFRKHLWIDSTVQEIRITKSGVDRMWVNGLEVTGDVLKNEFTKTDSNLITLKATNFDVDADIMLGHFVPVRSTDLDFRNLNYSSMFIISQGNLSFDNQSQYDCSNQTAGECIFTVEKGEKVKLNFTLRNAGELFARDFNLTVFARNLARGDVIGFYRETITMHPFSTDDWNVTLDTGKLTGGMYEFVAFADADDVIIETSEFNNEAVRKIYVNANPEVRYLDSEELQGYNENVNIRAKIVDEDGDLNTTNLVSIEPDNTSATLNMSGSGSIFSAIFNNTQHGRYKLNLTVIDALGKEVTGARDFDIFDSLYLNVRTDRDVYYYTQNVRLTQAKISNLTKFAPNSAPVLVNALGNVNEIKGGDRMTIETGAFDPDGDLVTLYVCKSDRAGSIGCAGGPQQTYCNSTGFLNPGCSFNTERDDQLHQWFAFVVDEKGSMAGPVAGNYTTDSTPPVTRFYSLASDKNNPIDNQNDSKIIITIQGEPGMSCRFGKDPLYRYHKDRSYQLLGNDCSASGGFANCNLGNLKKDDPSREKITNLTRAYVSCEDSLGNEQSNLENVVVEFGIDPVTSIFDDYQGNILAPDSRANINGDTYFCIDDTGRCTPNTAINNNSVVFLQPGVFHLRYIDTETNVKDTTVFVNSKPAVFEQTFIDRYGEHAFDVLVKVSDPDDQTISCILTDGTSSQKMAIDNGIAKTTLAGSQGETIATQVSCTDGIENVSTSQSSHTFPNHAPQFRNIPDISLESNETSIMDLSFFGFDLENDTLTYSLVSQGDTGIADANVSSNNLSVFAIAPGASSLCMKANDGLADSNAQCISIFVEDGFESKLKNNELANTTVRLLMQVQYFGGTWLNESSKEIKVRILPGSDNQIDLGRIFEWNSSTSSHPEGLFRVLFRAVDDNNNTLLNRDGKEIIDSYNFTLTLFNIPPNITGIPDQFVFKNQQIPTINLADYTTGTVKNIIDLDYEIVSQANSSLINCSITKGHFISCVTALNQTGTSDVNVSVFDGFVYSFDAFAIRVIPFEEFIAKGNLTYTFISDIFIVSGDPLSGIRQVSVNNNTPPGEYNITVIVSDGFVNISKNISVVVGLPGVPAVIHNSPVGINIPLDAAIIVNFSKMMNHSSVERAFLTSPQLSGIFNWTDNSMTFIPTSLAINTTYNVTITTDARDIDGNHLQKSFSWEFMTIAANIPPLAFDQAVTTIENTGVTINLTATDADNDMLSFIIVTQPIHGILGAKPPDLSYTPDANFIGIDNFTFKANDGKADSNIAVVNINVIQSEDTIPPVINSVTLSPPDITICSIININVSASDNTGVVEVTLNGTRLTNANGSWQGTINAPYSIGNYTMIIRAKDAANNSVEKSVSYEVVQPPEIPIPQGEDLLPGLIPQGGVSVAIIPKISYVTGGSCTDITLKINSTENFDDIFYVYLNSSGLPSDSRADQAWFNWRSEAVPVPARKSVTIPLKAGIPSGFSGTKSFRIYANSTRWRPTAYDTGGLKIATNIPPQSEDTTPPVINSVTLSPPDITICSIININVSASDSAGVVEVTLNGTMLTNSNGSWQGSINAPYSIGNYTMIIRAKDAANNSVERSVSYEVVQPTQTPIPQGESLPPGLIPQGGVSVSIIPKISYVTGGSCTDITLKINSTENFDDIFYVYLNSSALPSDSRADQAWFNWRSGAVPVPARKSVTIPLKAGIPSDISGTRSFRFYANSTIWQPIAFDTGGLNII